MGLMSFMILMINSVIKKVRDNNPFMTTRYTPKEEEKNPLMRNS